MAVTLVDFEGGTVGQAVTATGGVASVAGAPLYVAGTHGDKGIGITVADYVTLTAPAVDTWSGAIYIKPTAAPTTGAARGVIIRDSVAKWLGYVRFHQDGTWQYTNESTLAGTIGSWSVGTTYLIEWQVNRPAKTIQWQITPDNGTMTAATSTWTSDSGALSTSISVGGSGGGAGSTFTADTFRYDTGLSWLGPYSTQVPVGAGVYIWDGATEVTASQSGAFPVDLTYDADPARPEFVIRNDYIAAPGNRDTMQVWSHGEQTWWVNEWGGQRIRVAENSQWDAALRLIGATNQGGDMLEVQDSTRQNLLMRIKANGGIVAPNVRDPFVVAYGSDPIPTAAQKPCLVGRIGGTTTRYDFFDGPANGTAASGANGWDSVVGNAPVYSSTAAYSGHANGLVSSLNGGLSSYVVKKFPNGGYLNAGYARMRVRLPAYGDRNARVFSTEATTGGHRHPIRINTSGKVEITSYDGTTVLATSTTTLATNTWYDLGVKWDRGTTTANGSCEVRIYTTVGSDTAAETLTVSAGNFFGAGGDIWALRWGLQASNAGTNLLHIGMVAWSPDGWPTSTPPTGTASLFLHDGTEEIPVAGGGVPAVDWVNVTATGTVKGDGTTDDTAALQAVLNSAGVGATVYFPSGTYLVSAPLQPLRQQRLVGCHSPKYDPAEYPTTTCALRASAGFTGTALLTYNNAPGVTVQSLCLLGKGQTASGGLNGIDMGTSTSGEKQWWIKDCSFSAFNGAAITGSLWVGDVRDCHIGRCGYGIKTNGAEAWTDVRVMGTQVYFCTSGGIEFDTTKRTGLVTIIGCRVERSGNTYGNPASPLNPNAFGIRLGNVNNIELIGASTDACTGPGLWIGTDVTDSSKIAYSVIVTG